MNIKFVKKYDTTGDFVKLLYTINNKEVKLEIGGTALSTFNIYNLSENELSVIFIPVITAIYVELNKEGKFLDEISIDSEGAKVRGTIVYSKEKINETIKNHVS